MKSSLNPIKSHGVSLYPDKSQCFNHQQDPRLQLEQRTALCGLGHFQVGHLGAAARGAPPGEPGNLAE